MSATTGCWNWVGYLDKDGYGQIRVDGKCKRAHRASFEAFRGPIPDGLMTDHLCRNRPCCNPYHLDPVTHTINQRRGDTVSSRNYIKTHCNRGHELAGDNLMSYDDGRRGCLSCHKMKSKEWVENNRGRAYESQRKWRSANRDRVLARRRDIH